MLNFTRRIVFAATRTPALLAALLMVFAKVAEAMDFQIIKAVDGQRLVMAAGSIERGDAQKLDAALQSADRDQWGYKAVALWSPGGLVSEAMDMVRVMDRQRVNTIVLDNTNCASACFQILFVSGFYRMVTDGVCSACTPALGTGRRPNCAMRPLLGMLSRTVSHTAL
jgi:hypothetical protein